MEALFERPSVVGAFSGDAIDDSALPDQHHLRALEVARQESPIGKIREGRSIDAEIGSGQGLIVRVAHEVIVPRPWDQDRAVGRREAKRRRGRSNRRAADASDRPRTGEARHPASA